MTPVPTRTLVSLLAVAVGTLIGTMSLAYRTAPAAAPTTVPATAPIGTLPATTSSTSTTTSTTSTTTTTTTTVVLPAVEWRCPEMLRVAVAVGWPTNVLPTLDRVLWRESRCDPTATNLVPPDQSYGLMQVNVRGALWPDRQGKCGLTAPEDLLDPAVNLSCGLVLWHESGWSPWGM